MKKKLDIFGIYLPFYIVTTLTAVVLRTIALFANFDIKTGYFTEKTLIGISDGIIIAATVFLFSYVFFSTRGLKLIPDFTSPATYVPTGLTVIATIFMLFSLLERSLNILERIAELKKSIYREDLAQISSERLLLMLLVATAVFALLAIIHFALTALVESHSNSKRANFGICTVVFLALYSLYLYFSKDLPINAPNKALDQMAYLFAAVFFLYETRLSFGRERWRHYIAFGFIASAICAYSAIPSCIFYFASGHITANSVYELAMTLALFAFITSRLFLTGNLIEDKQSNASVALASASDSRDREINPIPEKPEIIDVEGEQLDTVIEENDGNQLTIDDIDELSDDSLYPETDIAENQVSDEEDEKEENGSPLEN